MLQAVLKQVMQQGDYVFVHAYVRVCECVCVNADNVACASSVLRRMQVLGQSVLGTD